MKIAFLIDTLTISGGAERVTCVLANALVRVVGIEVDIITHNVGKSFYDLDPRIGLISLGSEEHSRFRSNIVWNIFRLRRIIRRNGYDYLIGIKPYWSIVSIPATIRLKTKVISTEHSNLSVGGRADALGRWLSVRFAHRMVVLTDADKTAYARKYGERNIMRIYNPITIEPGKPSPLTDKRFLALGRFSPEKGLDMLLAAWASSGSRFEGWKLRIVGEGNTEQLSAQIEQLGIGDSTEILPRTKDVQRMYREASVYVMSSRFEGFPLVLIEAAAMGLPAVSFDVETGPREMIVNGETGLLVPPCDVSALVAAMDEMAADGEKLERMGAAALERSRLFSLDTIIAQWIELLK